ncbi:hypothetical protein M409DRAFT_37907 [Zasmidium cellare ATCC 36951]|uniref:Aminotransferase class I/classII large domain-containing protein n=1 Tax=Zasmidium cellare ATCC 36951 TaxID=1080233 RepID=A0A6A6BXT0_ZASCE|nr:uncharacterized protein M409DRAFT_37907 [Zasmidium cellare ATCC 36951]KAF2159607.1 hypothetical protein M409DRAFT_37907 [Zasmidium cellare ATCC 36951]
MLSSRGAKWATVDYAHGVKDTYDPESKPNGTVDFGNAENVLMHDALTEFINSHSHFDKQCCSYGEGYTGTFRLRSAMARHLNEYFHPASEIDAEQITFAAGVTDLNEVSALLTCDEGDAIMLGRPVYGAFFRDLTTRTGVKLEYISVGDTDQFGPECVPAFEAGFDAARERGINIKALMICNPHNPLGRCYPRDTLIGLMRLCAARKVHLISDEIYALSVYPRDDRDCEQFTSVRAIDLDGLIDPGLVHVLYGMSKDYGAGGLRLGCIISQNKRFSDAARAICRFSSPSQLSMALSASLLEDREFIERFLDQAQMVLRDGRLFAEWLLDENKIPYSRHGNAGLFIWLDLEPFLPVSETDGDGWAAARLLNERLREEGVVMSTGEAYRAETPGRFRLVFSMSEAVVREGVKR